MATHVKGLPIFAIVGLALAMPAEAGEKVLTVVERATSDAVADTGAAGDSPGDVLTFANELFDASDANKIGSDNGYCIRTVVGVAWECVWTNSLDGGQISVEGSFLDAEDSVLAITGGTGGYKGASGEMLLHARDAKGSAYDFTFTISQ
jgi:hypothetical protein